MTPLLSYHGRAIQSCFVRLCPFFVAAAIHRITPPPSLAGSGGRSLPKNEMRIAATGRTKTITSSVGWDGMGAEADLSGWAGCDGWEGKGLDRRWSLPRIRILYSAVAGRSACARASRQESGGRGTHAVSRQVSLRVKLVEKLVEQPPCI